VLRVACCLCCLLQAALMRLGPQCLELWWLVLAWTHPSMLTCYKR
jgi:hypothetical protein